MDILREGAREFVGNCKGAGVRVGVVSGDDKGKCLSVGWQTGVIGVGYSELLFFNEEDGVVQIRNCLKGFVKWENEGKKEGGKEGERLLADLWERCGGEDDVDGVRSEVEKSGLESSIKVAKIESKGFGNITQGRARGGSHIPCARRENFGVS